MDFNRVIRSTIARRYATATVRNAPILGNNCFILTHADGYSQVAIGKLLGIPRTSVQKIVKMGVCHS